MATIHAKKDEAALMLANGKSAVTIAKEIGTTPESISRWKMSPDFMATVNGVPG